MFVPVSVTPVDRIVIFVFLKDVGYVHVAGFSTGESAIKALPALYHYVAESLPCDESLLTVTFKRLS